MSLAELFKSIVLLPSPFLSEIISLENYFFGWPSNMSIQSLTALLDHLMQQMKESSNIAAANTKVMVYWLPKSVVCCRRRRLDVCLRSSASTTPGALMLLARSHRTHFNLKICLLLVRYIPTPFDNEICDVISFYMRKCKQFVGIRHCFFFYNC